MERNKNNQDIQEEKGSSFRPECLCPPKLVCWSPNSQCDGIRRQSFWDAESDGVMRMGSLWWNLCPLQKKQKEETWELPHPIPPTPPPLSYVCVHQGKAMLGYNEKIAVCKPGRGPSTDTRCAGTLILDDPASRTKRLLFQSMEFCYT